MSQKYSLNKTDGIKILKVLGWSAGSAIVSALITIIANIDLPVQYVWIIPIVNTILVTAQKFFTVVK